RLRPLVAAGGTPARPPATQPASRPADVRATADDLRASVLDSDLQLSQGYEGVYLDGLLHDARLVLIDVEPADILVGYDAQNVLAIRRIAAFGAEVDQEVVSKDLHVHIGDDGATGWVDDALSYRIVVGGRRAI